MVEIVIKDEVKPSVSRPALSTFISVQHVPFVVYCTVGDSKANDQ